MGFTSYYNLQQSLENARASEYRKLELTAASSAGRIDQLLIDIHSVVIQVSTERNVINFLASPTLIKKTPLRSELQQTLDNVFHSNPDYDAVYLLNKQGLCLASTDPTFVGQKYNFREYFQQAIQGRSYISSVLLGKTTKRPGLYLSNPVRGRNGELVGVAVIKIKGEKIWALVNALQIGSQGHAFLVDQHGIIISHPEKSLLFHSLAPLSTEAHQQIITDKRYGITNIKSLNIPELAAAMVGAKETGHTIYRSPLEEMPQMVGFAPLGVQPWVLGVSKPQDKFTDPLNQLIWQNTSNLLAVGAIAAIASLVLAQSITKPIRSLTCAAQALERDDFEPQTLAPASRRQDDMGQLVRVFTNMAEQVKEREQKLKQQVMELNIAIDEVKKARQVAEVTGTDYFKQLQKKAQKLRDRSVTGSETETDYFQHLQKKAQLLKDRAVSE
ncbi:HAMP domain-containing protein [Scytonema sp. UIC 10036]|nr:HAMP domain-containing protein [Scytonema sp. UIC 10036]